MRYGSSPHVKHGDHRPVVAVYDVELQGERAKMGDLPQSILESHAV